MSEWQPMATAPTDREIEVYVPGENPDLYRHPLPEKVCRCQWHPDAGFTVDDLRDATRWRDLPKEEL